MGDGALEKTSGDAKGSRAERTATGLVTRLIDVGIDGLGPLDPAPLIAQAALAEADGDQERAVNAIVSSHLRLAAAGGFATGLGGFITLPVALPANVIGFYGIATRMVAAIAHLRGHDVSDPQVRSAVLLALIGADSRSVLAKAGVAPAGKIADVALQRLPGPVLMVLNKGIGFRLLSQVGRTGLSRLGRGVPLVGGVVGAGMDWWLLRSIAENARTEFVQR